MIRVGDVVKIRRIAGLSEYENTRGRIKSFKYGNDLAIIDILPVYHEQLEKWWLNVSNVAIPTWAIVRDNSDGIKTIEVE